MAPEKEGKVGGFIILAGGEGAAALRIRATMCPFCRWEAGDEVPRFIVPGGCPAPSRGPEKSGLFHHGLELRLSTFLLLGGRWESSTRDMLFFD